MSTRARLIGAATTLIDQGGPEAVTLREVGRQAGVSHNAPYRHFADKRALLATIAAREMERGIEASRKVEAGEISLREMLLNYVRRSREFPNRFRLIYSDYLREDEQVLQLGREARTAVVDAVSFAQRSGEIPDGDPGKLGQLLFACAFGATYRSLDDPHVRQVTGTVDAEDIVEELLRILNRDQ